MIPNSEKPLSSTRRLPLRKSQPIRVFPGRVPGHGVSVKNPLKKPDQTQTFTKIFRWRLPEGQPKPAIVEIAGTFTKWQKVPLLQAGTQDAWQVTLHEIPFNRTHHYMLFVDGKPAQDKYCDGLAIPHGPQEEQCAMQTARGPRVFMLFAQTK